MSDRSFSTRPTPGAPNGNGHVDGEADDHPGLSDSEHLEWIHGKVDHLIGVVGRLDEEAEGQRELLLSVQLLAESNRAAAHLMVNRLIQYTQTRWAIVFLAAFAGAACVDLVLRLTGN